MKRAITVIAILCSMSTNILGAIYHKPNLEGKILVKIDQILIDQDKMKNLALFLTEIADNQVGTDDPAKLRASAKLLALAEQLDSSSDKISETHNRLEKKGRKKSTVKKVKKRHYDNENISALINYLSSDQSSNEGRKLAQMIKDAMAKIVLPRSPYYKFSAPADLWQGAIADLGKFKRPKKSEKVAVINAPKVDDIAPVKINKPTTQPKQSAEPIVASWKTRNFSISVPFTTYKPIKKSNTRTISKKINTINCTIKPLNPASETLSSFHSKPFFDNDHFTDLTQKVLPPLRFQWKKFPEAEFYFNLSDAYSTKNDGSLIYPHLLLALDSALRGTPLRDKLLVDAEINQKAQFLKSRKLSQSIDDLLKYSNGNRILVGPGSEDYFLQLLAFDKLEFFIQNELIEVADLIEARKFCSTTEHKQYKQALETFAEVRNALKSNTSLRSMTKNKFVRQKLTEVLDVIPHHLSSKILLEYGSRLKGSQTAPIAGTWKIKSFSISVPFSTFRTLKRGNARIISKKINTINCTIKPLNPASETLSSFQSKPFFDNDHFTDLTQKVLPPLRFLWKKFPEAEFYFNLSDAYSTKNDGSLIYPHLLLALDSALRGTPLRDKLLVDAEINQKAQFLKNTKLSQSIDDLLKYSKGNRILVGPDSEDYFLQLLAFDKLEFFIENELIEVADLIEARKFCGTTEHKQYKQALETFAEVSNNLKSNGSLRSITKNELVKQKLTEVLDVIPHHLSSKILLEYSNRLNGSQLDSKFFALSLNKMLGRLKRSLNANVVRIPAGYGSYLAKQINDELIKFDDIILPSDRKLYQSVEKIVVLLKQLGKTIDRNNKNYYSKPGMKILADLKQIIKGIDLEIAKLTKDTVSNN